MQKGNELYRGKAKTVYATDDPELLIMEFRDDVSAFNAQKLASLTRKGEVNNLFNAHVMTMLQKAGVATHFEKVLSKQESLVKRLQMVPVECVVRNRAAGGICKRLGLEEGIVLTPPVFEFFYKDDELGDPFINDSHILTFAWATQEEIKEMHKITLQVNELLLPFFAKAGFYLVDFKLEFGRYHGQLVLADEFTPDGCRIWDMETEQKFDKDRFRRDLGDVVEYYETAAKRLGISI